MPTTSASGSVRGGRGGRGGRGNGAGSGGRGGRGSVGDRDRSGRGAGSTGTSEVVTHDAKKAAVEADWFKAAWRKDGHQEKGRFAV